MVRLGDTQVEIPAQLLYIRIIVGVDYLRLSLIEDGIACFDHRRRINHILIKYRMPDKTAQFLIDIPAVCRTYIGAEKRFNAQSSQIGQSLAPGSFRIIENPGRSLKFRRILPGKLPCVCGSHLSVKMCRQPLHQKGIHRHGILCHQHKNIRTGILHPLMPGSAVVKFPF